MNFPIPFNPAKTVWLKIHIYLALSVGFIFALLGFTGSLSIYREEIDSFLNPKLQIAQPQGHYQSLDDIVAVVRQAHPNRHGSWTLEMPLDADDMLTAWYEKPNETFFEWHAPLMVSVNPYTAEVISNRFWGRTFTTWLLDLHTQLHLDQWGWRLVGLVGVMLILSVGSGLYLWWPSMRKHLVLTDWPKLKLIRFGFDLHRLLGFFMAIPILVLATTGFLLSYPQVLEVFAGSGMAHGETGRPLTSTAVPNKHPTSLAASWFVAQGLFPKAELRRVTTPVGDSGIYRINLRQPGEINRRHPFTTVWVDRWSGQIKEVRDPRQFSAAQKFAMGIWPVHTGEALSSWGRFCWFCAGQSLFILYVTGVARWLQRRGWVQDRPLNLLWLRQQFHHLSYRLPRVLSRLTLYGRQLLKAALPHLIAGRRHAELWVQRVKIWLRRQPRLGKK